MYCSSNVNIYSFKLKFLLFFFYASLLTSCGGGSDKEKSEPQISLTAPSQLWTDSGISLRVNASGFDMDTIVYSVDGVAVDNYFSLSGIFTSEPSTQNFDIGVSGLSFNATDALGNKSSTTWRYKVDANVGDAWDIPNLVVNVPEMPVITNNIGQIIPSRSEIINVDVYNTIQITRSGRVYLFLNTSSSASDWTQQYHYISEVCIGDGAVDLDIFRVELVCQHKNHPPETWFGDRIFSLDQNGNEFITDGVEYLQPYRYSRNLVFKFDQLNLSPIMQAISTSSTLPSSRVSIFDEVPLSSFTLTPLDYGDSFWMVDDLMPELLPGIYYSRDRSFQLKSNGDIIDADNSVLFDEASSQYLSGFGGETPATYGDCDVSGSIHSDQVWGYSSNNLDELPVYDLTMNIQDCTVPIQANGNSKNNSLKHASAHFFWSNYNSWNFLDYNATRIATINIVGQAADTDENLTYIFQVYRVCDEFNVPTNYGNQAGVICPVND